MEFKKILVRSLSGIIYIAIIVGCILLRSEGIAALTVLFGILATIEFTKITRGLHNHGLPVLLADIAGVVCLGLSFYGFPVLLWIACLLWRLVLELYTRDSDSLRNLSYSIMGQVYIGIPLCTMLGVSVFFGMPYLLLAIFMFIWLNDTGAFIVGCTFGRHIAQEVVGRFFRRTAFLFGLFRTFRAGVAWIFRNGTQYMDMVRSCVCRKRICHMGRPCRVYD